MLWIWRRLAFGFLFTTWAMAAWTPSLAGSHGDAFSAEQQKAIEGMMEKYILENPEVILQSINAMRARQEQAKAHGVREVLKERAKELLHDPNSHVGGNPDGDITLVEFFDYRCGYCKRVHPTVQKLLKSDGNIRFVYKEFPILGPESIFAARAAIAARTQGKYVEFHNALIELRGSFSRERVLKTARDIGLDTDKLVEDIENGKSATDKVFRLNFDLANGLDITGTPAFIVGDSVIRGAADLAALQEAVAAGRAAMKAKGG
jgi:protein-disulfide isomerase